jgi:putative FmdB family regulatory protein
MPLYEYQCLECDHQFEVILKFSDPPIEKCPKCGGPVRKLISSPAIQFKGSGFYITDYARKDSSGESKDQSNASADGGSKSDKSEKVEKAEKAEKSEKSEKSDKSEKPAAASSSDSSAKASVSPKAAADPVK